ncbi:unnamed protein product, partial [Ixodes pacificus]
MAVHCLAEWLLTTRVVRSGITRGVKENFAKSALNDNGLGTSLFSNCFTSSSLTSMWYIMSSFESLLLVTNKQVLTCIMLMPQYMEKALAISSSKKEKCLPLILLHSSATPIT